MAVAPPTAYGVPQSAISPNPQMSASMADAIHHINASANANTALSMQEAQHNRDWQAEQNAKAMQFSAQEAQKLRDWQERMSNTSYSRMMADMKNAGINPILAVQSAGASTPSGASASGVSSGGSQGQVDTSNTSAHANLFSGLINAITSIANTTTSALSQQAVADKQTASSQLVAEINKSAQLESTSMSTASQWAIAQLSSKTQQEVAYIAQATQKAVAHISGGYDLSRQELANKSAQIVAELQGKYGLSAVDAKAGWDIYMARNYPDNQWQVSQRLGEKLWDALVPDSGHGGGFSARGITPITETPSAQLAKDIFDKVSSAFKRNRR